MNVCQTHIEDDWLSIYTNISLGKLFQSTPKKVCFRHPIVKRLTTVVGFLIYFFFVPPKCENCICEVLIKHSNRLNNSVSCNLKYNKSECFDIINGNMYI